MLYTAFILGLLGSLHCIGMCGPIAFMLPVSHNNSAKKAGQIALYHSARLLAYALIGLIFGIIGKGLYIFGLQQQLSIIIGIVMILFVVLPARHLNTFKISQPIYRVITKLKSRLGQSFKRKTADTFLTIGFLNGFLPCGLVYMAVFGALASANAWQGSLYMVIFGLGTVPLMTFVIYFSKLLKGKFRSKIQKAIPIIVVLIGVLFILRGLGLGIPYISPSPVIEVASNAIECH